MSSGKNRNPNPKPKPGPTCAPATHDDGAYAFVSDDVISDLVVMLPGPERQSTDGDQSGEHEQGDTDAGQPLAIHGDAPSNQGLVRASMPNVEAM